jgi:hypothetical protein
MMSIPAIISKRRVSPNGPYNQIANFVLAQSEINIAIGDEAPDQYMAKKIKTWFETL